MPNPSASAVDRRLLGGLTPGQFLARHWQRRPLLVRGAVDDLDALPGPQRLADLAARDDVESRLITSFDGRWTFERGPFDRLPRRKRDWTLLVQGVNLHDDAADRLMRRFDFVSALRLDDLMISYAADGGGVGPHFDSYDVFLLQVEGRRRWRWRRRSTARADDLALVEGAPVKRLARFEAEDDAVLEPGDMLYLPPDCAHEGVAIGACTTASIGFRAPSWRELSREFLFEMADHAWPDGLYADPGRPATRTPAAIDDAFVDAVSERLSRIRWTRDDVVRFIGRYFSEPKADVFFDPPAPASESRFAKTAVRRGLAADRRTVLLHRGRSGFIAGEPFSVPTAHRAAIRTLADRRRLAPSACATLMADPETRALLHAWWSDGWIRYDEGG